MLVHIEYIFYLVMTNMHSIEVKNYGEQRLLPTDVPSDCDVPSDVPSYVPSKRTNSKSATDAPTKDVRNHSRTNLQRCFKLQIPNVQRIFEMTPDATW